MMKPISTASAIKLAGAPVIGIHPFFPDAVKLIESLSWNISHLPQQLDFNPFNKLSWITEGNYILNINYGPDQQRRKTELSTIVNGSIQTTKYFLSNYEKIIDNGDVYEINYITAPSGLCAMYVTTNGAGKMYYVYSDHLGSILKVTDHNGTTYEQNFDAWGRYRNPDTWDYSGIPVNPVWLHRGFTSHEHLQEFVLINMNGRLYDPVVGAMLSPDNYVADAGSAMAYNRYSYCLNNPLTFVDPDGNNPIVVGILIGVALGAYSGGVIANQGNYNPTQWKSDKTLGYMLGGAVVGGISGYAAATIALSGGFMANTASIAYSSMVYSMGMNLVTEGQTPVAVGFGFGSYNLTTGEFEYLGKKGNSALENIVYGLGTLANVADVLAGFKPGSVELRTENDPNYHKAVDANGNPILRKDLIGHSQITDGKGHPLVDWGPTEGVDGFGDWVLGTNSYEHGLAVPTSKMKWSPITIDGVNTSRISVWNPKGNYNLAFNSCVSQTSRALNASGAFNIGIHPYLLHAQMYLRSIGIRPMLYSHLLYH